MIDLSNYIGKTTTGEISQLISFTPLTKDQYNKLLMGTKIAIDMSIYSNVA